MEAYDTGRPRSCPPDMLARIAVLICEAVDRSEGDLDRADFEGIYERFPAFRAEVDSQIAVLRRPRTHCHSSSPLRDWPLRMPERLGRYLIGKELGRGASGVVVSAMDEALNRQVALKILLHPWFQEREARALAAISDHPNVTSVHAYEEQDGMSFIVMELVHGVSMDRIVTMGRAQARLRTEKGALGLYEILDLEMSAESPRDDSLEGSHPGASSILGGSYFREISRALSGAASALHGAHAAGIVHRDVKPANLLLTPQGVVKITDFSHAKSEALLRLSRTGQFIGTCAYASPEQIDGRQSVGPTSDIWSLGASLYELVTLTLPFTGDSEDVVMKSILNNRPKDPRDLNSRIPPDLALLTMRCLEHDAAFRYATAGALAEDLERFADGEAVRIRAVSRWLRVWYRLKRPTRRSAAAHLTVIIAAVALTVGTVLLAVTGSESLEREAILEEGLARSRSALARGLLISPEGTRGVDPGSELRGAMEAGMAALSIDPSSKKARFNLLVTAGQIASQIGDDARAARLLGEAKELGQLPAQAQLRMARAAFAIDDLQAATAAYADLLQTHLKRTANEELRLVRAFAEAPSIPIKRNTQSRWRYADASTLPRLPLGSVLTGCGPKAAGSLLLFVNGLAAGKPIRWEIPGNKKPPNARGSSGNEGAVFNFLIKDIDGDGSNEVVACGWQHLFISRGPFSVTGPEAWQQLPDPLLASGLAHPSHVQENGEIVTGSQHLAAFHCGDSIQLAHSRYRAFGRLTLRKEPGRFVAVRAMCDGGGGDIESMRPLTWDGAPALLVAMGPWHGWSLNLFAVGESGEAAPVASALVGPPQDAIPYPDPTSRQTLFLAAVGGQESYLNPAEFGRSQPQGWEYGLHVLRADRRRRTLVPVALLRLPRPHASTVRLHLADLLPGLSNSGRREILISEEIRPARSSAQGEVLERTHVVTLGTGSVPDLEPRLRLPGCVAAVVEGDSVATRIIVKGLDGTMRVVRTPQ